MTAPGSGCSTGSDGVVIDESGLFEKKLQEWEDYYNFDRRWTHGGDSAWFDTVLYDGGLAKAEILLAGRGLAIQGAAYHLAGTGRCVRWAPSAARGEVHLSEGSPGSWRLSPVANQRPGSQERRGKAGCASTTGGHLRGERRGLAGAGEHRSDRFHEDVGARLCLRFPGLPADFVGEGGRIELR